MSQKLFVLSIALLLGLVVSACDGVGTGDKEYAGKDIDKDKLQRYGKLMELTFPESTRPLNSYEEVSGIDDSVYLKVEIDQKDVDTLISKSPFATAELSTDESSLQSDSREWWDPDSVKDFKSGEVRLPDGTYLRILIDFTHAQKPIVYLQWFET